MKIKLLLISLFTSMAFTLSAQEEHEYIPFVRDCEFGYYNYDWGDINGFIHYWIEGEFQLEGETYKGFYNDAGGEKKLIGYVREENKKVYFHDGQKEWPWYDFSLEVGDTFCIEEGSPMVWEPFETEACGPQVQRTESLDIYGKARKSVMLDRGSWVEGVGDDECLPFGSFAPRPTCPCGYRLFYIKENDQFVYRLTTHWGDEVPINDPYLEGQYAYVPLVREGVEWGYNGDYGQYRYQIKGDSVVDGVRYKKMYKYTTCDIEEDSSLRALVREEGRKVYARGYNSSEEIEVEDKEYLIYDFSAQAGDEVALQSDFVFGYMDWGIVDRVDTIQVGNQLRRKLSIVLNEHIEGIGSLHHDWFVPIFTLATCYPDCNLYQHLDYVKNLETGEYEYGTIGACDSYGEYDPIVKDCTFGYYHKEASDRYQEDYDEFFHYRISGERKIGEYIYKGLSESTQCDFSVDAPITWIREEGKKVYMHDGERDWLWYDFTLEKGDILTVDAHSPLNPTGIELKITVLRTDTLLIAGKMRKHIHFEGYDSWLEGVGTLNRKPLRPFDEPCGESCGTYLYYQRVNDKYTIVDRSTYGGAISLEPCESSIDHPGVSTLHIAQHPEQIVVTLPDENYRMAEVLDTIGRVVWCEYLGDNSDTLIIPTSHWVRGVYIVALTSQNGERVTSKVVK